jgi:hypothetical protein
MHVKEKVQPKKSLASNYAIWKALEVKWMKFNLSANLRRTPIYTSGTA